MDDINKNIQNILNTALASLAEGSLEKALDEFRSAEVIDRNNPAILFNIGITYTRLGLYKSAIEYFRKVLTLESAFIELQSVRQNIAFCLIQTGNYTDALQILDEILLKTGTDTVSLNMKGFCYFQLGMFDESLETYKQVLQHKKTDINSLNSTAYLMSQTGLHLESAYKLAQHAVNKSGHNPAYLDTLGHICVKLNRLDEAEKHLVKALSIMPFNREIQGHYDELLKLKNSR